MDSLRQIAAVASQEFTVTVRNKWTIIFAGSFALLVLAVAVAGMATEGFSGMQDFTRTSATILNLILYLVPLIGLLNGATAFTGDRGSAELLFVQPLPRSFIVLGKLLGLFAANAVAIILGYSVSGAVIAVTAGWSGLARYASLGMYSLALCLVFLSLAAFASVAASRKIKAFAYALLLWFFFVILYDVGVMFLALQFPGKSASSILMYGLLGNPVSITRVASLIALDSATVYGASGAALVREAGGNEGAILIALTALTVWIAAPIVAAIRVLNKQDL